MKTKLKPAVKRPSHWHLIIWGFFINLVMIALFKMPGILLAGIWKVILGTKFPDVSRKKLASRCIIIALIITVLCIAVCGPVMMDLGGISQVSSEEIIESASDEMRSSEPMTNVVKSIGTMAAVIVVRMASIIATMSWIVMIAVMIGGILLAWSAAFLDILCYSIGISIKRRKLLKENVNSMEAKTEPIEEGIEEGNSVETEVQACD